MTIKSEKIEAEIAEVLQAHKSGMTIPRIAKLFGKSTFWVYCRLNSDYHPIKTNPKE
jgi:ribosomal protein S24E